ncbi:GntR family transcriptional regulator [Cryobacterium sp. GrIS_2_6]|uniref:FadR/GntR family transcriptional regulator n=1 Tax=Cryobacterium sp. GrIS_2_6 TaxID=3162785 RepID=UPI002DFA754F|nr:GntR family transcriptional regulator [Cryobacterium psychrotolerans]MEC5152060.1 DNA-binding FadR family transcriptional regulator [Cryobacterium psychrotolerans]
MEAQLRPGAREAIFAQLIEAGRAEQVARRLTDAIILGVLTAGERLPSEQELARRFGVALITVREGLVILRESGLVETRRGRGGGSFVIQADAPDETLLHTRLRGVAHVELSDLAVYFSTIIEGCAERAALRAAPHDADRLSEWLAQADWVRDAGARANAGGFYLELAVLSQSARLVREQVRLQAEFGPLLLLGLADPSMRARVAACNTDIVAAIRSGDGPLARTLVAGQVRELAEWLHAAKTRIERGGTLHAASAVSA